MGLNSLRLRRIVAGLLIASLVSSGCTKTVNHRIPRYRAGSEPTTKPVPQVALYKVKIYDRDGRSLHGIDGTERLLQKGELVGFHTDDAGVVYAVANNDTFALPPTLPRDRKIVWAAQYKRQTQFGKEVEKALVTAGTVAVGAAIIAIALYSLSHPDDCDDEQY
jgi:hypothetical protein